MIHCDDYLTASLIWISNLTVTVTSLSTQDEI